MIISHLLHGCRIGLACEPIGVSPGRQSCFCNKQTTTSPPNLRFQNPNAKQNPNVWMPDYFYSCFGF